MSAARVIQKLKPLRARCEIRKLFIEGFESYINTSDACPIFADNVDLFF